MSVIHACRSTCALTHVFMHVYIQMYIYIYIYIIYISGKITVCDNLPNSGEAYKALFSEAYFVHSSTTFYGASIGEVRFGGTFRISDLQGVGLWSDFQNLVVGPQNLTTKSISFKRGFFSFNAYIPNLKSELRYLFISFI